MTADQIRNLLGNQIGCTPEEYLPHLQLEVLVEIAAQLAKANELRLFELGLDEETK